jgi:hypothetical protein
VTSRVPELLRRRVAERAGARCEYCGLSQAGQEATFHVDHVIPVNAGGETRADNLALACVSCSLRKAARTHVLDSVTGRRAPVFNPRVERWDAHFRWDGVVLVGLTAIGRATVDALRMNRALALAIRREETALGRHPPR